MYLDPKNIYPIGKQYFKYFDLDVYMVDGNLYMIGTDNQIKENITKFIKDYITELNSNDFEKENPKNFYQNSEEYLEFITNFVLEKYYSEKIDSIMIPGLPVGFIAFKI